jgi:hypothetical protein
MAEQENEPNIIEKIVSFFSGGGGGNTGGQSSAPQNNEANDGDADVGFLNSLAMGFGFKDPTDDYYRATLDSINRSQGAAAAERYRQRIMGQGVLSVPGALNNYDIATMSVTGQPPMPQAPTIAPPQAPMTPMPQTMQPPMQQGVGSLMQPPGAIRPLV